MTHPAIDLDAVARLRRQLGRETPQLMALEHVPSAPDRATTVDRIRDAATRFTAPLFARARRELAQAAAHEQVAMHDEIEGLRSELQRTRTEHAAEIAVLHEQVRERIQERS